MISIDAKQQISMPTWCRANDKVDECEHRWAPAPKSANDRSMNVICVACRYTITIPDFLAERVSHGSRLISSEVVPMKGKLGVREGLSPPEISRHETLWML